MFQDVRVLEGHTGNIHAVTFSKDGMLVGGTVVEKLYLFLVE